MRFDDAITVADLRLTVREIELARRARVARHVGRPDDAERFEAMAVDVREQVVALRRARRDPCKCGGECCEE